MRRDPSGSWFLPRVIMIFTAIWMVEVLAAIILIMVG